MTKACVTRLKIYDTFVRSLFVVFPTYSLPLDQAGNFGLWYTFIGFLAFILGFERHIDSLREVSGNSIHVVFKRLNDTLRFFLFQYTLIIPAIIFVAFFLDISSYHLFMFLVILIGEHLSNQSYIASIIHSKFYFLLATSSLKNTVLFAFTGMFYLLNSIDLSLDIILYIWSSISFLYVIVIVFIWIYLNGKYDKVTESELVTQNIKQQYIASSSHFLIGVISISSLQLDKFLVGGMLASSDVGTYFRHVTLGGMILQFFNIVYFNRVSPIVFKLAREGADKEIVELLCKNFLKFLAILIPACVAALAMDSAFNFPSAELGLTYLFFILIIIGTILRAVADLNGLLLLTKGFDSRLVKNQALSVGVGFVSVIGLSLAFNLTGVFIGALTTPFLLAWLNFSFFRKHLER